MKVIYHDRWGRHISILAASLHLQLIDENVSRWDLRQLPYFLRNKPPGTLLYMGLDSQGNEIFVLGRKNSFPIIRNAYLGLNRVFKLNQDFIFADVEPLTNITLRVFDFLNPYHEKTCHHYRYLNGLFRGLERATPGIRDLVLEVKRKLQKRGDD